MNRKPSFLFPVLLFCLSGAIRVAATTYTVKAGGSGNFTTIQACANVAVAGDTCQIYSGTYNEVVTLPASGTSGSPITFVNNGTALVTGFAITNQQYVTIQGLSLGNHSAVGTPGVRLYGTSHITVIHNIIQYTGGKGVQFNAYPYPATGNSTYVILTHNTISWTGWNASGGDYGIDVYGDYNLIDSNDISHAADYTHVHGSFDVVRNNTFHDSASTDFGVPSGSIHIDGMQTWGVAGAPLHHLLMENNTHSNVLYPAEGNVHFALLDDNTCTSLDGASDVVIRYNTYYANDAYFTIAQNALPNVRVYNNTIANATNPQGSLSNWANCSTGGAFINNVLYNTIKQGYTDAGADGTSSPLITKNSLVYLASCGSSCSWANSLTSESGVVLNHDPLFVNPTDNFELQAGSPAIGAGTYLTTVASGDSGSGTSLIVNDAGFFQDGYGISGVQADWVRVGTATKVQIASINYTTNTITLASAISRSPGNPVYLYKNSNGTTVLSGSAPDIGAVPSGAPAPPTNLTAVPQ